MSDRRGFKREDLRTRLIGAAQARIESGGLRSLRARDVTADAGCALGALYNAFNDLDDLILHVNSATLARLDTALADATYAAEGPGETLKVLAFAYLAFARENHALWEALFEHRMPAGVPVPEWHLAEHAVLIRQIIQPLSVLQPALSSDELAIRGRTLFAAVHGVVAISLEERFIGPGQSNLEKELEDFLEILIAGLEQGQRLKD